MVSPEFGTLDIAPRPEDHVVLIGTQSTDTASSGRNSRTDSKMKPRIMYIELKTHGGGHDDNGPAWISRVTFSATGKTIYWRGKTLQRGTRGCGNHFDVETDDDYWVSGPKKNGQDRYPWAGEKVRIDPDVRDEYWTEIRKQPERAGEEFA